jgi:hypothetical protein
MNGALSIDFGEAEKELEEISWTEFFKTFEANGLAFLYEEEEAGKETDAFFKLVDRNAPAKRAPDNEDEEANIEP